MLHLLRFCRYVEIFFLAAPLRLVLVSTSGNSISIYSFSAKPSASVSPHSGTRCELCWLLLHVPLDQYFISLFFSLACLFGLPLFFFFAQHAHPSPILRPPSPRGLLLLVRMPHTHAAAAKKVAAPPRTGHRVSQGISLETQAGV